MRSELADALAESVGEHGISEIHGLVGSIRVLGDVRSIPIHIREDFVFENTCHGACFHWQETDGPQRPRRGGRLARFGEPDQVT